jgi:hypothetical protein
MRRPADFIGRLYRRPAADDQYAAELPAAAPERSFRPGRHAAARPRESAMVLSAPPAHVTVPAGPAFSARRARPSAVTAPHPVARPYVSGPLDHGTPVWPGSKPVIGDSLTLPAAPAAFTDGTALRWLGGDEAAERVPTAVPYTRPGWAGIQMKRWVCNGEWDALPAIVEEGLDRNAAAMAIGLRHNRTTIAAEVWKWCAAEGWTDLAAPLLRRVQELAPWAARAVTEAARAAAEAAGAA